MFAIVNMLQWTWENTYLLEALISFPLSIYSKVGLLDSINECIKNIWEEEISTICNNMAIMLSESKLYRGRHYGIAITHIHVESEIAELRETESKQGLQGLGVE